MELAQRLISTRRGSFYLALLTAIVAGALILVYLNQYRHNLKAGGAPVTVLVASHAIPKGTPGSVVASKGFFTTTTIRESQLRDGALSDPASLTGKVAAREVFEGSQLTAADFSSSTSLAGTLTDRERIVAIPLDAAHGLIGQVQVGNHVDVYAGFNVVPLGANGAPTNGGQARPMLRLIMSNIPVVATGSGGGGLGSRSTSNVGLQVERRAGCAARVRIRQRQDLAVAASERRCGTLPSRPRHGRDAAPRRAAGERPPVARWPSVSALALRVLLVLEHGVDGPSVEAALPPGTRVRQVGMPAPGQGWSLLGDAAADADLVILGCAHDSPQVLELVEAASRELATRPPIVVLHAGSPNGFMQRAFHAGADDLITLPQSPAQLAFALEKAVARRRGTSSPAAAGEIVTVLGPKGGTGKTLTTCNLAVALAESGRRPVVVDLDLQFGDVGLALGLRPERTIYDLAVSGGTLDAEKVEDFLVRHGSGAHVLLAPVRPDQAAAITIPFLRTLFDTLRSGHDFVIVDTPPAFTPEVIAAIDSSSHLCMVGMLDALSLKDTKIGLQTLAQMGYDPERVTLVLNRADTSVGISQGDVDRLLGRAPDVLVPSDRAIPRAVTDGETIVEADSKSRAARAFTQMAASLVETLESASPATPKTRRRLSLTGRT